MVEKRPEREALVFMRDGIRKTFAEFKQDVDQLAAGLLALGLKRGARLGMWGPNTYEWLLIQFATAQTGIILVSVNPAYQVKELEFVLQKVGCTAVVCPTQFKTQRYYDMLKQVCPELEKASPGGLKSSSKQPGAFQMSEVMQAGTSKHLEQLRTVQRKLSCDDPINIQFTSGTTGSPKGAVLSHHNIVNNANLIGLRLGYHWKDLRVCLPVPMYHCFAMVGGAMVMALHGCTLVFPSPSFEGRASLEAIQTERHNGRIILPCRGYEEGDEHHEHARAVCEYQRWGPAAPHYTEFTGASLLIHSTPPAAPHYTEFTGASLLIHSTPPAAPHYTEFTGASLLIHSTPPAAPHYTEFTGASLLIHTTPEF
ncbi:hypothetical protein EOD39_7307 [Acipenser ruthenus]|uniref:Medium-chain acyl-CoA ligase ACSF2, mitochondrial n=1 Tax=Acipenser ruthenus TaxID=7906 RepID=A0A444U7C7_ACIRT|nr:hypothetical protein EOD39_7307 [Acipenser ruthenus]